MDKIFIYIHPIFILFLQLYTYEQRADERWNEVRWRAEYRWALIRKARSVPGRWWKCSLNSNWVHWLNLAFLRVPTVIHSSLLTDAVPFLEQFRKFVVSWVLSCSSLDWIPPILSTGWYPFSLKTFSQSSEKFVLYLRIKLLSGVAALAFLPGCG